MNVSQSYVHSSIIRVYLPAPSVNHVDACCPQPPGNEVPKPSAGQKTVPLSSESDCDDASYVSEAGIPGTFDKEPGTTNVAGIFHGSHWLANMNSAPCTARGQYSWE